MEKDNMREENENVSFENKNTRETDNGDTYSSDLSSDIKRQGEIEPVEEKATEIPSAEAESEKTSAFTVKADRTRKKRKGHKGTRWLFDRKESFIMRLIDRAVVGIYDKFKNGTIGHFFTSYGKVERAAKTSATVSFFEKISAFFERRRMVGVKEKQVVDDITGEVVAVVQDPSSRKRPMLKSVVSAVENSVILRAAKGFLRTLFYLPMSTYGATLLSLGITTILVQAVNVFLFSRDLNISSAVIGVAYALIAMMTIFSGDSSLAKYICDSRLGSFLLVSVFGVSKKTVDLEKSVRKYRFWAFLVGVALGLLSAVFTAKSIFFAVLIAILVVGVAQNPESGVIITIFALPFASLFENGETYLCIAVLYTVLAWVLKILSGQRRIAFGVLDGWVAMFVIFVFVTGLVSVDKAEAGHHALVMISSMLGFFAVSNLLSSHMWMRRGINALLLSGFAVAASALCEWVAKASRVSWKFSSILENEITSVFADSETLSLYLVMIFFFALAGVTAKESKRGKFSAFIVLVTSLVGIIFTLNVYAWVALVAVIMLYSLIKSRKNAASVFGLIVVLLLVLSLASDILPSSLTGIADGNFEEKLEVTHTAAQMAGQYLIGGIGLGDTVFENVYAHLASAGSVLSSDGGSLFMEMLIRFGFMGVVFVTVAMVLAYRQAFSTLKLIPGEAYATKWTVAAISSLTGALLISTVSYIWSDMSVALLFWMTVGFVCASRHLAVFENTGMSHEDGPSLDIPISSFRRTKLN